MDIPSSKRVNTGCYGSIYGTIDGFFQEIIRDVRVKQKAELHDFEIRVQHFAVSGSSHPSDDGAHTLRYQDRVIAAVIETRTQFNYVQFDFFKNLEGLTYNERHK